MRVTELRATALSIPRQDALATSYGSRNDARTVLVELETDVGLTGLGQAVIEAPFYGETLEGTLVDIRRHLAPVVVGASPAQLGVQPLLLEMERALPDHPVAVTAVETALWDLAGKAWNLPVSQLLGGKIRDGIRLMGALPHGSPDAVADAAATRLEESGYHYFKLKIGIDPDADIAVYRAVAEAVSGRARLHVDANAGYTLADAQLVLSEISQIGALGVVEQPVAGLANLAEIARQSPAPVMVDESLSGIATAIDVVRCGSIPLAFLKLSRCGGLLNALRISTILSTAGMRLAPGIYYDVLAASVCHLAAAAPGVDWPAPMTAMTDTILSDPLRYQDNLLRVPDGPGLGVEIDRDKVDLYTVGA